MRPAQRVVSQPLCTAPRRCHSRRPASAHRVVRTPPVLREPGLPEGDLRRASAGADRALPAAHPTVAGPGGGRRRGAGRPRRCPNAADPERHALAVHGPVPADAGAASTTGDTPGAGGGRLRALRRHLRHPPGRRHHPAPAHTLGRARRGAAQPVAPQAPWCRGRLSRRLPHLPAGNHRRRTRRRAGQRPLSPLAGPLPPRSGHRLRPPRLPGRSTAPGQCDRSRTVRGGRRKHRGRHPGRAPCPQAVRGRA